MNNINTLLLLITFTLILDGCATKPRQNRIQHKNLKTLETINLNLDQKNYEEASIRIDELSKSADLTSLELAYIANYRANICYENKDFDCAFREFETVLANKENIPTKFYNEITTVLFKLHYSQKNYSASRKYAEQNLATVPEDQYLNLATLNFFIGKSFSAEGDSLSANEKYENALSYGNQHIAKITGNSSTQYDGTKFYFIENTTIIFLISLYKELNRLDDALELINSLSTDHPKIKNKLLIASYYEELGNIDSAQSLRQRLIDTKQAGYKDGKLIVWNTDGVILPKFRANPTYPMRAAKKRLEGSVDLKMDIDELGKTKNIRITASTANGLFDDAALKAASQYLYEPFIKNGEPSELKDQEIRIAFEMEK